MRSETSFIAFINQLMCRGEYWPKNERELKEKNTARQSSGDKSHSPLHQKVISMFYLEKFSPQNTCSEEVVANDDKRGDFDK